MPPQRLARHREGLGRVPLGSETSHDHIHYSFQVIGNGLVVEPKHPNPHARRSPLPRCRHSGSPGSGRGWGGFHHDRKLRMITSTTPSKSSAMAFYRTEAPNARARRSPLPRCRHSSSPGTGRGWGGFHQDRKLRMITSTTPSKSSAMVLLSNLITRMPCESKYSWRA